MAVVASIVGEESLPLEFGGTLAAAVLSPSWWELSRRETKRAGRGGTGGERETETQTQGGSAARLISGRSVSAAAELGIAIDQAS
eukprot:COSAG03_NODE_1739_length_3583_cov_9.395809_2_plen_85_part_00